MRRESAKPQRGVTKAAGAWIESLLAPQLGLGAHFALLPRATLVRRFALGWLRAGLRPLAPFHFIQPSSVVGLTLDTLLICLLIEYRHP